MGFDPFKDGGATEVLDRPTTVSIPAPTAAPATDKPVFDPFKEGSATAHTPSIADEAAMPQTNSAPKIGNNWKELFGGINREWDNALDPKTRAVFQQLDNVTDNSDEARMQAVNQAYLSQQIPDLPHSYLERNWPSIRDAYANTALNIPGKNISDAKLYSAIAKQRFTEAMSHGEGSPEERAALTWKSPDFTEPKAVDTFWQALNRPVIDIPEAPKDLPDIPQLGLHNPALVGGVYNALKPLVEGLESPLGIATLGVGGELHAAAKASPVAKALLVAMTGTFTGLMGYGTAKATIAAPKILRDPEATFEDKVTAVVAPVADAAVTLLGVVGTAMEMMPKERATAILKEAEGKNPAQVAEIFRKEAVQTDIPSHADFLMDAAHELEQIASVKDKASLETEKVDIGKRDETVSTGTGVETPHEKKMMEDWKKQNAAEAEETKVEPKTDTKGLVGIKNEAIDAQLKEMGLPEATHGEKTTWKAENEAAAARVAEDPLAGQKVIEKLSAKDTAPTASEVVLALREMNRLRIERDAAESEFIGASTEGDAADMMDAKLKIAQARDAYAKAADVVTKMGTLQGQAFAARALMMKEDYSLAAIERRRTVANQGKPLTDAQRAEVLDLHKKLTEAEQKINRYEDQRRAAKEKPIKVAPRPARPPTSKARQFLAEQAEQARARIRERLTSGRVQSGLDPADLADHAIIGAEYLARGVTKFTDWSVAMVNELGETIRPHLQEIFKQAIQARDDASKLQAYKTRTARATEKLSEKLASGDTSKPERRQLPLDKEAIRLRTEYARIKRKVDLAEMEDELANRGAIEKTRGAFQKWVRLGALSYPTVFLKLTGAAVARLATTPLEQLSGLVISKALPELAAKAKFEGVPTLSGAVRAESKAMTEGLLNGIKAAGEMLRGKDSAHAALLEKEQLPPGFVEYLGKLHGAFKAPAMEADFSRRLQLATEHAIREGVNVTDPVEQLRLMHESWAYAKRSIFMQDNGLVNAYKGAIRILEGKQKAEGKPSAALQFLSTGLQAELPIVKVPTNVIFETSEAIGGSLVGPARAAWAYVKGIENLSGGEADAILRLMKKGSIGSAFLLLGWFNYKNLGGFHQSGEKRKPREVQPGEMRTEAGDIPRGLLHNTYAEVAQYGATVHRVAEELTKKAGGEEKGPLPGIIGATIGLFDEVPFVRETTTLGRYADDRTFLAAVDQKAASILVPGLVQWIAAQTDKKTPFSPSEKPQNRKATDLEGNLKKAIPGLREDLPRRK